MHVYLQCMCNWASFLCDIQECMSSKKPGREVFQKVFDNCVYDICMTGLEVVVCDHGKALADECLVNGHETPGWRFINDNCSVYSIDFTISFLMHPLKDILCLAKYFN